MVFPLLPGYAKMFDASDFTIGLLAASFAVAQLLFSPLWGHLSDKYGRKPIIAMGLLGIASSFLLFAVAATLLALFLGRFLQGMFSAAALPAARAYIADLTSKEQRVKAMGHLGAALALGIILGPAIGGLLATKGIALPFFGAALVAFINLFFVLFFLKESLLQKSAGPIRVVKYFFLSFLQIAKGLKSSLAPLCLLSFLWSFALSNNSVVVPLLGLEKFHLDVRGIGMLFTVMGIGWALTQIFFLTRITKFLGEHLTVIIGLLLMAVGFTLMPLLPSSIAFLYAAIMIAGLGSAISRPVITALVSKETTEAQGITMGITNSFEALGRLIGPILGGFLFAYSMSLPFLFSSFVVVAAITYILFKTPYLKKNHAS
jgi:multidrug resistance protein